MQAPWLWLLALLACCAAPAAAHEVRPAFLEINEVTPGRYAVAWKQPAMGEVALRLVPEMSNGWLTTNAGAVTAEPDRVVKRWTIQESAARPLIGARVRVDGLEASITNVLVVATRLDGRRFEAILTPDAPATTIAFGGGGMPVPAYFRLGLSHILTGVDHLCFVLGLLLLVGLRPALIKAITAFTVAHSITLAASALGLVHAPPATIEALVALSILFLAVELVRARRGETGIAQRHTWLIAFIFGLLHGFAFAGALAEVGLPEGSIPQALLLFNLGVEAGQLLFVAVAAVAMMLVAPVARRLPARILAPARFVPDYALGGFAGFWVIARTALIFV